MKEIKEEDIKDGEEYIIEYENGVKYIGIPCFIGNIFDGWMVNITHEFGYYKGKRGEGKIVKIYIK